ncbi:MAG: hypothetical protein JRH20_09320 [Deltaproteobacteria bacterium]|nr:hypothetical protein [Deltaproteobacteria bacterium]
MNGDRGLACLNLKLVDDRSRKTVVDHIVHGLVHGSLLGEGLAIQRRDAATIHFSRHKFGVLGPSSGQIGVSTDEAGKTAVHCQLWCGKLRWQIFSKAVFMGAVAATIALLLFGWLIVVSAPVAAGISLIADFLGWRRARNELKRRFETFLSNSRYFDHF